MNDPKELARLSKHVRRMIREGRQEEIPVEQLQALVRQETKERCEQSLHYFFRRAWHVIEPGKEFVDGKHIHAVCEHLEAVTRGEIKRLIINVPYRSSKSSVLVAWSAWDWTKDPSIQYLTLAHDLELATRDTRRMRMLCRSPWYQSMWPIGFAKDQNLKQYFENDENGYRIAAGMTTGVMGKGADRIVIDDAIDIGDALSKIKLKTVHQHYDEEVVRRLNEPNKSAIVIVGQRVDHEDLVGHVLSEDADEWEVLCIPMRYETDHPFQRTTSIGWSDWRKEDGELMCPERFPEDWVRREERRPGAAGQLQQRPTPRGGAMFKRHWFEIVDTLPRKALSRVRAWDIAGTQDGGAYTVGLRMMLADNGMLYIEHVVREQVSMFGRHDLMKQTANLDAMDDPSIIQAIEKQPGASGKDAWQMEVRLLRAYNVIAVPPKGDKEQRAFAVTGDAEAGNIKLLRGQWNHDFLDEIESFPRGRLKDQVDALSTAHSVLAAAGDHATPSNESFVTSGEFAGEDLDKPFTQEELQELPEYLQEILTEMNASAEEKRMSRDWEDPEDDVWREDGW